MPKARGLGAGKPAGRLCCFVELGIQAAVSLHLVNQIRPDIPVILTDTGYLFPETYQLLTS